MKKRVIIFLNRLVIGGVAQDVVSLAWYLRNDYEILLLVGAKNADEAAAGNLLAEYPGLRVEELPGLHRSFRPLADWRSYRQVKKLMRRFGPAIVHTHGTKPGIIGRLAARECGVPVILHTYHGHVFHSYFTAFLSGVLIRIDRWLARFSTRIIAISSSQKEELVNQYQICGAEKVVVIPLGVETEKFRDLSAARAAFRQTYLLREDDIAVGIIGRIVPIKNHSFFIEAVKDILEENPFVRVFIVGDGSAREALEGYLDELMLSHTYFPLQAILSPVTFTSWQTDIVQVIAGLDIVALSSLNEGTPLSLMEAQAAGKPVISTRAGGVAEILLDQATGYLIEQGDLARYRQKLKLLIDNDTIRQKLGANGQQFIQSRFSKPAQVAAHRQLYSSH